MVLQLTVERLLTTFNQLFNFSAHVTVPSIPETTLFNFTNVPSISVDDVKWAI
jgi:hypothetical protein